MINDQAWKDLTDKRRDTHLTLFDKIANYEVNTPTDGMVISAKASTSTSLACNNFMHIEPNMDDYKYLFLVTNHPRMEQTFKHYHHHSKC